MGDNHAGYITKISDLKKIIADAEKLGLKDDTKIIIEDANFNKYTISNAITYHPKTKKISLFVE